MNMKKCMLFLALGGVGMMVWAGCSPAKKTVAYVAGHENAYDTLRENGNFTTFVRLIDVAGMADTFRADVPYTIFAPTDAAFSKLSSRKIDDLQKPDNRQKLLNTINYHVVSGNYDAKKLMGMGSVTTLQGQSLTLKTEGGKLFVNKATVVNPDMATSNGRIHSIDEVLMP